MVKKKTRSEIEAAQRRLEEQMMKDPMGKIQLKFLKQVEEQEKEVKGD